MDLRQFEHLAPEGATHLFWASTWDKNGVYAYFPDQKYKEAYHIHEKVYYAYGTDHMEEFRKRATSFIYEIPPLNLENV